MDENIRSTDNLIDDKKETAAADAEKLTSPAKKKSGGIFAAILYLIGNFFLFNIVFVLLLLPVVTIGTALTAYFDIVFTAKYDKKHRDYSVGMLLKRFREHLKLSMSYFIGYLLVMGFFIAVALVFSPIGPIPNKVMSVIFILMAGLLFAVLIYTFPVLAINAVTSDYRAAVYAIQDRDRLEARKAREAEEAASAVAETSGVEASEPKVDEVPNDPGHNTEVLTAYMKRFSKVTRTETPSREIMKKADTSSSIKYFADEDKPEGEKAEGLKADDTNAAEQKAADVPNATANETNTLNKDEFITNVISADELKDREDRNSLGNVLLDSIYFAAKHFVGLMFTVCLYILPALIIYIFYEDTVALVAGLIIIGARIIMGINARIYYGSFFEYDDDLFEDDLDKAADAATDEAGYDNADDEIVVYDAESTGEVEATDNTETADKNDSDEPVSDSEETTVESDSNDAEETDESDNDSETAVNAADSIKDLLSSDSDEDQDEDIDEELSDEEIDDEETSDETPDNKEIDDEKE